MVIFHCYVSSPEGNQLIPWMSLDASQKQQNAAGWSAWRTSVRSSRCFSSLIIPCILHVTPHQHPTSIQPASNQHPTSIQPDQPTNWSAYGLRPVLFQNVNSIQHLLTFCHQNLWRQCKLCCWVILASDSKPLTFLLYSFSIAPLYF